ncbi:MAG: ATP-binding protein [Rivularia sp. (in: Bacteria)]|nr:ATP-binding protein [Rivularia sp. MS3]
MAALKPWYKIDGLTPREDLREGKPLDASEFAVHLDKVRDETAPADYKEPERFFDRTYLTKYLTDLAAQVVRRLSGEKTETSAVFNLATQFGGGKTHALTLLYHLAKNGAAANRWTGVQKILQRAEISSIPEAAVAVFVGTEFDSIQGRGGDDGTPLRKTPWGEIAYQLGGAEALAVLAEHEAQFIEPKGDVIRKFLPKDKPCLILMDEIINYISSYRRKGYNNYLYNFIQALSETARSLDNVVLVVSIPASEMEYTSDDEADEQRFKKMLDRVGKPVIMSAESETSEIIRRRLFEWEPGAVTADGRILLPKDAIKTCNEYADWVLEHRQQLPSWFPLDNAREAFQATYPFHPTVLSVFERKWQALPRFQRTRGVLRLLALWVSNAYQKAYQGGHRDHLVSLGTAPLDDPQFRAAAFEQLGETRLEGAVTTDICGKKDSHAVRLDAEAVDIIKKTRLHRKVTTTIFFESNGGCTRTEATIPEIRLAVAEPSLDIGNVETVLDTLSTDCYYLSIEKNKYRFSLSPNLNKILADRRANVQSPRINERVKAEIQKVFAASQEIQPIYFPENSSAIPNRAVLTLAILAPEHSMQDGETVKFVESMTREYGTSDRTFKSAIIWAIPESNTQLREEARKVLAWEDIRDEESERLDESQKRQLQENLKKAQRDLKESVWRSYKNIALLGKDNKIRTVDLGMITSSMARTMVELIFNRLRQDGDVEDTISPRFIVRNWSPAFTEWSTKAVRDAFFASPRFPRLLNGDAVKEAIVRGVKDGTLAYVGKTGDAKYEPFQHQCTIISTDIEISDDVFIITQETAEAYKKAESESAADTQTPSSESNNEDSTDTSTTTVSTTTSTTNTVKDKTNPYITDTSTEPTEITPPPTSAKLLKWAGTITPQKWMNFYTRVLSKFAANKNLKLTIEVSVSVEGDISAQKIEETKVALQELGLDGDIETDID